MTAAAPSGANGHSRPLAAAGTPAWRLARSLAAFTAVLTAIATVLLVLDRVPGLLAGLPRGATRVASLAQLERELGMAIPLPVFYPSDLAWPPSEYRLFPGPSAVVIVTSTDTGEPALLVGAAAPGLGALPPQLLPAAETLQTTDSTFGARRATVARVRDAAGIIWHQAAWTADGRLIVVRYHGDFLHLSRLVESMAR
jgi:hypothetical protein